jgi:hypothetical protein
MLLSRQFAFCVLQGVVPGAVVEVVRAAANGALMCMFCWPWFHLLLLLLLQVWSVLQSQAVLLGELTRDGQTLRVAVGGKGGRGNATSPSKPYGPASRARSDGQPGQEVRALLLRLVLPEVLNIAVAALYVLAAAVCVGSGCRLVPLHAVHVRTVEGSIAACTAEQRE